MRCFCFLTFTSLFLLHRAEAGDNPHAILALQEWLTGIGAVRERHVRVEDRGPALGLGLVASQHLNKGDVALSIWRRAWLTVENMEAHGNPVPRLLRERATISPGGEGETFLAAALWEVGNTSSFWAPYFQSLPNTFPGQRHYWTDEQDAAFQGILSRSLVEDAVDNLLEALQRIFDPWPRVLPSDYLSRDRLTWLHCLLNHRSWLVDDQRVVIPLMDWANHDHLGAISVLGREMGDLVAGKDMEEGEELFIAYDPYMTLDAAVSHYGFLPAAASVVDTVRMSAQLSPEPLKEIRERMFRVITDSDPRLHGPVYENTERLRPETLAFFRIFVLQDTELDDWRRAAEQTPISLRNELEALQQIIQDCEDKLTNLPTSVEEDVVLLQHGIEDPVVAMAVDFRMRFKRILQSTIDAAHRQWTRLLSNMSPSDLHDGDSVIVFPSSLFL